MKALQGKVAVVAGATAGTGAAVSGAGAFSANPSEISNGGEWLELQAERTQTRTSNVRMWRPSTAPARGCALSPACGAAAAFADGDHSPHELVDDRLLIRRERPRSTQRDRVGVEPVDLPQFAASYFVTISALIVR